MMLQYSTYSVISPEGCASILWKSADKAPEAAEALGITSERLLELGLVDRVIEEPLGGAHRAPEIMAGRIKAALLEKLEELDGLDPEQRLERRYRRLMDYGAFQEAGS
jgi:acetyl-CoA carboxylase carboxyl transferase subunit alpha